MPTASPELIIFYDGRCPLCVAEMRQLAARDGAGRIGLEDIQSADFPERYPNIDPDHANTILHGQTRDGRLLLGLDVTCAAWSLVGARHWVAFLRWPLIRPVADVAYRLFARHRYRLSRWLTGRARCEEGMCALPARAHNERNG